MSDIETNEDVIKLVDHFYETVFKDDLISVFFTEIMKLDKEVHLPIMYNFWQGILLQSGNYKGNPMIKHFDINKKKMLKPEHFDRWLILWKEAVSQLFEGPVASNAIERASQIGSLMKFKMQEINSK